MIPYGRQTICQEDIDAVVEVLQSDWLTQGPKVLAFEQALQDYCQVSHAVAVNNATAGLHLACLALGVGPGDIVLTVPITFVASANAVLFCGAQVDFVDILPHTWCMDPAALAVKLETLYAQGKRVKAIIPVHFGGLSCDMKLIHQIAQQYHCKIIEDASHAIGGKYHQMPVGSCTYADMTIFSFHPVKIITTGEGGAVLTNNLEYFQRLKRLANHGITRDPERFAPNFDVDWFGEWSYQQIDLGYNYRITDFQCALGLTQLQKLDDWVQIRNQIAFRYQSAFSDSDISWQTVPFEVYSSYHLFAITLPKNCNRRSVFCQMRAAGIGVNVHYIPVHTQPYYQKMGFILGQYPEAEKYYRQTLSLPMYPSLSEEEQNFIIAKLNEAVISCID
jgi:UDP-4-amino-4,6-dideoxy-N-acetyl-beta-L-altrosamine transaminase